jgi:hypothetical protein
MALSVAMTAVAGGYVLMAGNSAGVRIDSMNYQRIHYAAEAGAMLGMRWLREYPANKYSKQGAAEPRTNPEWTDPITLTPTGYTMDGLELIVKAVPSLDDPRGDFQIVSEATFGNHRDTVVITWGVTSGNNNGSPPPVSTNTSDFWYETYKPGKP